MEDIEYLEEYEDLILPACLDLENENNASAVDELTATQSDDDSLSTYDYIFERLFDDHSDTESVVQKKTVDSKLSERQNDARASLDSLDMLVRDLNQRSTVNTKSTDCDKPKQNVTPQPHSKTVIEKNTTKVSSCQTQPLSSVSTKKAEQKVASTSKPHTISNEKTMKTKSNAQGATRKADSTSQIRLKSIATVHPITSGISQTKQQKRLSLPPPSSSDIAVLSRKNISFNIGTNTNSGKISDSTITSTASVSSPSSIITQKKVLYRTKPTIIKPKKPSPNRDPIEDPLSFDLSPEASIKSNGDTVQQNNMGKTSSPISDKNTNLKGELSSSKQLKQYSIVEKNDSEVSTVSKKELKPLTSLKTLKTPTEKETVKILHSEKVPQNSLNVHSHSNSLDDVKNKSKKSMKEKLKTVDKDDKEVTPETQVPHTKTNITNEIIDVVNQPTSPTKHIIENEIEVSSKKRTRGKRDCMYEKSPITTIPKPNTPSTRSSLKRRRKSSSDGEVTAALNSEITSGDTSPVNKKHRFNITRRVCFANDSISTSKTPIKPYKINTKQQTDQQDTGSINNQENASVKELSSSNHKLLDKAVINQTPGENMRINNEASAIKFKTKQTQAFVGQATSKIPQQTKANQETNNSEISLNKSKSSPAKSTSTIMTFSEWLKTSGQKDKCDESIVEPEKTVETVKDIPAASSKASQKKTNTMRAFLDVIKTSQSEKAKKLLAFSKNSTTVCESGHNNEISPVRINFPTESTKNIITRKRRKQEISKLIESEPMDIQDSNTMEIQTNQKEAVNTKNIRNRTLTGAPTTKRLESSPATGQLEKLDKMKGSKHNKASKDRKLTSSSSLVSQLKYVEVRLNRHAVANYLKNQLAASTKVHSRSQAPTSNYTTTTTTPILSRATAKTKIKRNANKMAINSIKGADTNTTCPTGSTDTQQTVTDGGTQNLISSSKSVEKNVGDIETVKQNTSTVRSHQVGRPKKLSSPHQNRRKQNLSSSFVRTLTSTPATSAQSTVVETTEKNDKNPNREKSSRITKTSTETTETTTTACIDNAFIPIEPKEEMNYDAHPNDNELSFGITPRVVDGKGTRLYSFLHPARYHADHGNVQLDFCCPNLDGPMTAIDPTRIHSQVQATVRELPAYIVLTTKVLTRADVEADKNAVPASIRQKMDEITANNKSNGVDLGVRKDGVRHLQHVDSINKTQQSKTSVANEASDKVTTNVDYANMYMNRFDELLRKHVCRMPYLGVLKQRQCIRDYISSNKVVPQEVDRAIRLLVNYTEYLHNWQKQRMQPSINAASKLLRKQLRRRKYQQLQKQDTTTHRVPVIEITNDEDLQISPLKNGNQKPSSKNLQHGILQKKITASQSTSSSTSTSASATTKPKSITLRTNKCAYYATETNIITVSKAANNEGSSLSATPLSSRRSASVSQSPPEIIVNNPSASIECILPDAVEKEIKHERDDDAYDN